MSEIICRRCRLRVSDGAPCPECGERNGPRVSIITTVYDRIADLDRCLRSVQHLEYLDFEQIVVSDAPPSAVVAEIARLVTAAGPRVRHINLARRYHNWGIAPAARGLQSAVGEFVCFLSDDNAYLPGHFGPLVAALEADSGLGFVYSSCLYMGKKLLDAPKPGGAQIDLGQPLFRREALRAHGLDTLPFTEFCWDWRLIDALMTRGVRWQHVNIPSFIFRLAAYPEHMRALA